MYLRVETAPPPLLQLRKQHRVFGWWAGVQAGLFSRTEAARQLQPAITKPSDDGGLYCIANEGSTASGCVQVPPARRRVAEAATSRSLSPTIVAS